MEYCRDLSDDRAQSVVDHRAPKGFLGGGHLVDHGPSHGENIADWKGIDDGVD